MKIKSFLLAAALAGCAWTILGETVPPIACNLKTLTSEQRKQLGQAGEHVISAITASRELNDGYVFRVDPAKASLMDVAQWLDLWRRCCPFYEFQIDFHAAIGEGTAGREGIYPGRFAAAGGEVAEIERCEAHSWRNAFVGSRRAARRAGR
jgi:hypothetical protein